MDPTLLLVLCFLGGALAGALVTRWAVRRGERTARDRLAELEIELGKVRSELEARGAQIASHFERTSDLFRDLTQRYTQLYAHLAEGARQFCPEDLPAIARGLEGLLPADASGSEPPSPGTEERHRPEPASAGDEAEPRIAGADPAPGRIERDEELRPS
jgi:uncharacterized membrane-anchored protein YhcB (DUF1043 family)